MKDLITQLQVTYPNLIFKPGKQFCWEPENYEIGYNENVDNTIGIWSILHETGHALSSHLTYKSDLELLRLEIEAWEKAKSLAADLYVTIDEEHIQDCLDTYRNWLYNRSICPNCTSKCLQQGDFVHYRCFNCHTVWRVSNSRFCRAYRRTKNIVPAYSVQFKSQA
jgi:hypothetical protein